MPKKQPEPFRVNRSGFSQRTYAVLVEHLAGTHWQDATSLPADDRQVVELHQRFHPEIIAGQWISPGYVERTANPAKYQHDRDLHEQLRRIVEHDRAVADYERSLKADAILKDAITPGVVLEVIEAREVSTFSDVATALAIRFSSDDVPIDLDDILPAKVKRALDDLVGSGLIIKFKGSDSPIPLRRRQNNYWYFAAPAAIAKIKSEAEASQAAKLARKERFDKVSAEFSALFPEGERAPAMTASDYSSISISLHAFEKLVERSTKIEKLVEQATIKNQERGPTHVQ